MIKKIVIKGAKEHNLRNISLDIPKDKFVVITGQLLLQIYLLEYLKKYSSNYVLLPL